MMILYLVTFLLQAAPAQQPAAPPATAAAPATNSTPDEPWVLLKRDMDTNRTRFQEERGLFLEDVTLTCNPDRLKFDQDELAIVLQKYRTSGQEYWETEIKRQDSLMDALRNQRKAADPDAEERTNAQTTVEQIEARAASAKKDMEQATDGTRIKELSDIIAKEEANIKTAKERLDLLKKTENLPALKDLDEAIRLKSVYLGYLRDGLRSLEDEIVGYQATVAQAVAKRLKDCARPGK
jgi:hypothetical protein